MPVGNLRARPTLLVFNLRGADAGRLDRVERGIAAFTRDRRRVCACEVGYISTLVRSCERELARDTLFQSLADAAVGSLRPSAA